MAKISFNKIFIIVMASLCLGITYNYFSQAGVPLFDFSIKKQLSAELLRSESFPQITNEPKHISLKEALKLHEANATFIDARAYEDYQKGHIENAINIPYYEFDKYQKLLKTIPKDEPLVSYCEGSDCDLSIMLGNKLASMGYDKIFIFFGGWSSWAEAKYPMSK
ncbi:MAG: rhodanese-like domain-containing protein [Syntrophomonadaceae bacterium]